MCSMSESHLPLVVLRGNEVNDALYELGGGRGRGREGRVQVHARTTHFLLQHYIQLLTHLL